MKTWQAINWQTGEVIAVNNSIAILRNKYKGSVKYVSVINAIYNTYKVR